MSSNSDEELVERGCQIHGCTRDQSHTFWDENHGENEQFCSVHAWTLRFPTLVSRKVTGEKA